MFFFALAHLYAFPVSEFLEPGGASPVRAELAVLAARRGGMSSPERVGTGSEHAAATCCEVR
jgi:hypothetical protein